jgi:SNF2 family DNA or RNA helicase
MKYLTQPYKHQENAVNRFVTEEYGALFLEQGLGKSKIILDLIANSNTKNILILAPNGLHANWYFKEIEEHYGPIRAARSKPICGETSAYFWKGPPTSRPLLHNLDHFTKNDLCDRKFFLMNVEAIRTKNGFQPAFEFLKKNKNTLLCIDESTCIKNPKAIQTKAAFKLAALADRRFILTGTPMTQGPLDLFSQAKFLHSGAIPYRTYTGFKAAFAEQETCYAGNRSFQKIVGYRNLEHLTEIMKPFSLRLLKKDCLDLPEKIWQTQLIEMTKAQTKAYQDLKTHALTELAYGDIVSSTIPLTTIMKLQQICSGFVTTDDGKEIELPNNKIKALLQIAENAKPLVIFCAFRRNVSQIANALADHYDPKRIVTYIGGMDNNARTEARERFQNGEADFILCTSAGAKGLTLTRANTLVYFSNSYQLETRLQSQDRIHRIGQEETCNYIDLTCQGTIDQRILEALQNKKQLSDMVLADLVDLIKHS